MRVLGRVLLACLVIAALQGILAVLAVAAVLLLIWGILFRPAETAGFLLFLLFLAALGAHPVGVIGVSIGLAAALSVAGRKGSGSPGPTTAPNEKSDEKRGKRGNSA